MILFLFFMQGIPDDVKQSVRTVRTHRSLECCWFGGGPLRCQGTPYDVSHSVLQNFRMPRAMTSILAGCCWTVVVIEDLRVFPVLLGLVLLYNTKRVLASLV